MAIIDACPHLELLDVSKCYKLDVDDALRTKCAGIKTVKLPLSLSHDGDQYAYCDYQIDEYGDFIDDYADYFWLWLPRPSYFSLSYTRRMVRSDDDYCSDVRYVSSQAARSYAWAAELKLKLSSECIFSSLLPCA